MSNRSLAQVVPESNWAPIVGPLILAILGVITAASGISLNRKCTTYGNNTKSATSAHYRIIVLLLIFLGIGAWSLVPTLRRGTEEIQKRRANRQKAQTQSRVEEYNDSG